MCERGSLINFNVWRNRKKMYQLTGVRYSNGEVSLQNRPRPISENKHNQNGNIIKNNKPEIIYEATSVTPVGD